MINRNINWDSTNIGENYPGITLPLTYTFVKDAYSRVYANFLSRIGVNQLLIDNNRTSLDNMLGYINGHIYYNIDNWYLFLQFLPGYRFNKRFFEAMLDPVSQKTGGNAAVKISLTRSLYIILKFSLSLIFFGNLHRIFEKKYRLLFRKFKVNKLPDLDNFSLVNLFRILENDFFSIWAITIINDFRVMIFYGLLKSVAESHPGAASEIYRNIYNLKNQPRSILPLSQIYKITRFLKSEPQYIHLFRKDEKTILTEINSRRYRSFKIMFDRYLADFGDRSSNELKLEEPKFRDHPEAFIRLLKNYLGLNESQMVSFSRHFQPKSSREIPAVYPAAEKLLLGIFKKITVTGIYQREYYRMKRGETFGLAREVFLEIGRRLRAGGSIAAPDDIFYLYKHEVFDYIRFHNLPDDLKNTVSRRKRLFAGYAKLNLPRKIITGSLPGTNRTGRRNTSVSKNLIGMATSRGSVTAPVIVMEQFDLTKDCRGKILVTGATDPGWTIIFPLLKGIITEYGGVLSHASIIARELNIPCIVKVADATKILKSGQIIGMDGTSGKITIRDK
jgi:pyruvate,water dikinase